MTQWESKFGLNNIKLSESEFVILSNLIHEKTGIYFSDNKRDLLEDKLSPFIIERGFSSFLDYYYLLKYDSIESDIEWRQVTEILRVPETFFFREMDQINAMIDVIIPEHFASNPNKPLRILSAACSSGEEPLTIAMLLKEQGWLDTKPIEISAIDISRDAIRKVQKGLYRNYSIRNIPEKFLQKYFEPVDNNWQIAQGLIDRIKFATANLTVKSQIAHLSLSNIIFCRNVFIYFSEQQIRQTVQVFYDFMPSPGYLFVGSSESLLRITTDFDLQEINGAYVYVKK